MILYKVTAWNEIMELDFSPCKTYMEAKELGDTYYPQGYDIDEIDTDDME